jgi:serine/threonine protein kinase
MSEPTPQIFPASLTSDYVMHVPPLGEGAYGVVYRATYRGSSERAVKIFKMGTLDLPKCQRELEKLQRVQEHSGIITVYDFDLAADPPYYVMSLHAALEADGNWLGRTLQRSIGQTSTTESLRLLRQVAESLAYLHKQDIAHCDVKPSNVLLTDEQPAQTKLCDFGQSRVSGLKDFEVSGTPFYASPEQLLEPANSLEGRAFRWDVYSFGVLAYEMLTGKLPRLQQMREDLAQPASAEDPVASIRSFDDKDSSISLNAQLLAEATTAAPLAQWPKSASIPQGLKELICRCLEIEPQRRPASLQEVITIWNQIDQAAQESANRLQKRYRLQTWLAIAALVVFGAMFVWMKFNEKPSEAKQVDKETQTQQTNAKSDADLLENEPKEEELRLKRLSAEAALQEARSAHRDGYTLESIARLTEALEYDPTFFQASTMAGNLLFHHASLLPLQTIVLEQKATEVALTGGETPSFATAGQGGEVKVMTGNQKPQSLTLPSHCTGLAFQPQGKFLAVSTKQGEIFLLTYGDELEKHRRIIVPNLAANHTSSAIPDAVSFSPDGKFLAARIRNFGVLLWDMAALDMPPQKFPTLSPPQDLGSQDALHFTPDGTRIFLRPTSGELAEVQLQQPSQAAFSVISSDTLISTDISSDGQTGALLLWPEDQPAASVVRFFDTATEHTELSHLTSRGTGRQLTFGKKFTHLKLSRNGRFLALRTLENQIVILDVQVPLAPLCQLRVRDPISAMAFNADATQLAVTHEKSSTLYLLPQASALPMTIPLRHRPDPAEASRLDVERTQPMAMLGKSHRIAALTGMNQTGAQFTHLEIWNLIEQPKLHLELTLPAPGTAVVAHPTDETLFVSSTQNEHYVVSSIAEKPILRKRPLPAPARCLAYDAERQKLYAATTDHRLLEIDPADETGSARELASLRYPIQSLAMASDPARILITSDQQIYVYTLTSEPPVPQWKLTAPATSLALDEGGGWVATGFKGSSAERAMVQVRNLMNPEMPALTLQDPGNQITSVGRGAATQFVEFFPSSVNLITSGWKADPLFWDLSLKNLYPLPIAADALGGAIIHHPHNPRLLISMNHQGLLQVQECFLPSEAAPEHFIDLLRSISHGEMAEGLVALASALATSEKNTHHDSWLKWWLARQNKPSPAPLYPSCPLTAGENYEQFLSELLPETESDLELRRLLAQLLSALRMRAPQSTPLSMGVVAMSDIGSTVPESIVGKWLGAWSQIILTDKVSSRQCDALLEYVPKSTRLQMPPESRFKR